MHPEYIVSSRNLYKNFPVPIWTKGLPLKVIYMISFIPFFTPFVAEVHYHILLYVVVHCTKGVVELTYK